MYCIIVGFMSDSGCLMETEKSNGLYMCVMSTVKRLCVSVNDV